MVLHDRQKTACETNLAIYSLIVGMSGQYEIFEFETLSMHDKLYHSVEITAEEADLDF